MWHVCLCHVVSSMSAWCVGCIVHLCDICIYDMFILRAYMVCDKLICVIM